MGIASLATHPQCVASSLVNIQLLQELFGNSRLRRKHRHLAKAISSEKQRQRLHSYFSHEI
jgi:hypothetical protein